MVTDETPSASESGARVAPRSPREALQPEPAPPPPASRRARRGIVVFLSGIFTFLLLAIVAGGGALFLGKTQFEAAGPLSESRAITIPRGQGTWAIAQQLEREGVIGPAWLFLAGVVAYDARGELKAGEYQFPERVSMHGVLNLLVEGRSILHQVTFPEGFTSEQIVERLRSDPVLVGEIDEVPPEGSLLPDTYRFSRGMSRSQIIEQMMTSQRRVLAGIWERRDEELPLESPEDLVILASIVEKETGRADERARVAGVFINRIRQGMRLQSDPTILYGLYGGRAFMEPRTITRSELDAPNNFSTYQIDGLPPTPIGNPGHASMEAVANPSSTDDLYFVADGTGGHAFAQTLDEHNRNVAQWREIERQRREERARPADEDGTGGTGTALEAVED